MIVVTGATGHLGRLVVTGLLERGIPADSVVAAVRSPEKAADLAELGVRVRRADYDRPETLKEAFAGASKVLLISSSEVGRRMPQHQAVIDAATSAGVGLLAYTGALGGPKADFQLAAEHRATEQAILDSGLPHTFLRNGWYNENYSGNLAPVLAGGAVVASSGDGRIASAARLDYAEAAAAVLAGEGHENRAYELSGDTAWNMAEYATLVADLSGKQIAFRDLPPEEYKGILVGAGTPEPFADILVDVDAAISRGLLATTTGDLSRLIGRPTTPIADSVAAALRERASQAEQQNQQNQQK